MREKSSITRLRRSTAKSRIRWMIASVGRALQIVLGPVALLYEEEGTESKVRSIYGMRF